MIEKIETAESLQITNSIHPTNKKGAALLWCGVVGWSLVCAKTTELMFFTHFPVSDNLLERVFMTFFVWLGELIMISILLWQHSRKEILRIDSEGLSHRQVIFIPLTPFHFTWKHFFFNKGDFGSAKFYRIKLDLHTEEYGIEFQTKQSPLRCFVGRNTNYKDGYQYDKIENEEIRMLTESLNAKMVQLGVISKGRFNETKEKRKSVTSDKKCQYGRWKYTETPNGLSFRRNGWIPPHIIIMQFLASAFMLGFFYIMLPLDAAPTIIFYAMILLSPCLILGVIWFFAVLTMLVQYFVRYTIEIENGGVRYCRSICGIERNKFWRYDEFTQVQIFFSKKKLSVFSHLFNPELILSPDGKTNPFPCTIQLINQSTNSLSNDEPKIIAAVKGLQGYEAKHIKEEIQRGLDNHSKGAMPLTLFIE